MSIEDYERGRTDERLDVIEVRHAENLRRFDVIEKKLNEIANAMAVAKGGLRMLLAVGTISAAIGAFLHQFIDWFSGHVK